MRLYHPVYFLNIALAFAFKKSGIYGIGKAVLKILIVTHNHPIYYQLEIAEIFRQVVFLKTDDFFFVQNARIALL